MQGVFYILWLSNAAFVSIISSYIVQRVAICRISLKQIQTYCYEKITINSRAIHFYCTYY